MHNFVYNNMAFTVEPAGAAWDIYRHLPGGGRACMASGLFSGLAAEVAHAQALALVKTSHPAGVNSVGPDVAHPNSVSTAHGIVKIVGPLVAHPNFVHWQGDSSSFAPQS